MPLLDENFVQCQYLISMIVALEISCVRGPYLNAQCTRTIEIDEETSLYDLHETIQDAVDFERDHLYGFFLAHSHHGHRHWLSNEEEFEDRESKYFQLRLCDVFPTGRKKLFYLFDLGDDWTFQIRKRRGSKPKEPGVRYPRLIASIGPNPVQYPCIE